MYKVSYLDRNGFIVVNDDVIMVFDYYSDPSHILTMCQNIILKNRLSFSSPPMSEAILTKAFTRLPRITSAYM